MSIPALMRSKPDDADFPVFVPRENMERGDQYLACPTLSKGDELLPLA